METGERSKGASTIRWGLSIDEWWRDVRSVFQEVKMGDGMVFSNQLVFVFARRFSESVGNVKACDGYGMIRH